MKKNPFIAMICFLLFTLMANAQTPPNAFNYSAVARNAAGQPIASKTIGIQISILKGSPSGNAQYIENHSLNTDAFGLFNLVIGGGAVQSGALDTIDWSNDNYYLKVGMDANGGTNFLTMGTTQLLSVPYAMYAKRAGSVSAGNGIGIKAVSANGDTLYLSNGKTFVAGNAGGKFTHYIGEEFGGGVIFHLWKDVQGVEHGLIVDKTDLSTSQAWSNIDQTLIGTAAQSTWDGFSNSSSVVSQTGHINSAAALCLNSTNGGQNDWYLPSIQEFNLLWNNYYSVSRSLSIISGATELQAVYYWSSTEFAYLYAWYFGFFDGHAYANEKKDKYHVRAIRAF